MSGKNRGGAPVGNTNPAGHKNAKGNKSPTKTKAGDQIAKKHGGYCKVYLDSLSPEELNLINDFPDNEEDALYMQIALYSVQERQLMTAISSLMQKGENGQHAFMVLEAEEILKRKA